MMQRRHFCALPALALAGCQAPAPELPGGYIGTDMQRGHALRERLSQRLSQGLDLPIAHTRRTDIVIAGGGIAGLAAARALRMGGCADMALLELQEEAGGNSRGTVMGGLACPQGAHYLPIPGDDAPEVQALLEEWGLRYREAGRWRYDEIHLCHSPQERLFFQGHWQEGLLPTAGVGEATLAQYRHFAQRLAHIAAAAPFHMPSARLQGRGAPALAPLQQALDAQTFDAWLSQEGLTDIYLRWYLNYCCRDDFGAGTARVSAWAGLHYFASRHGFHAPQRLDGSASDTSDASDADDERDAVLTWPEGNAHLAARLAQPLQEAGQLHSDYAVLRIAAGRHGVEVDAMDSASGALVRWQARRCIVALPVFIAARVVQNPPDFLRQAATEIEYAPWLVANIHLRRPLQDRPGAPPAWDNVLYDDPNPGGLGYVNAGHQRLSLAAALTDPTVLTYYQALGDGGKAARAAVQAQPWQPVRDAILTSLRGPHPDIDACAAQMRITRYGHAMAIPRPGNQAALRQIGLQATPDKRGQLSKLEHPPMPTPATGDARLVFAHADWAGYSVFEEAFTRGHSAGALVAALG